jgi:putative acetyltransferase
MKRKLDEGRALRDKLCALLVAMGGLDETKRPCGAPLLMPHAHALLTLLERGEPISITTLSSHLQIDRTNVSRLCKKMEDLGEIRRVEDPSDKRSSLVTLTERGQTLARHVDESSAAFYLYATRSIEDRALIERALEQLVAALETTYQDESGDVVGL